MWLGWADRWSPVFLIGVLLLPLGLPKVRRSWAVKGMALIAAQTVFDLMGLPLLAGSAGALLILLSLVYGAQQGRKTWRVRQLWLRRYAELGPMRLQLPFRGRWKALQCGPNPGRNHHLAARDQWFAVDFVRVDGVTRGSEILAPADGVVAYVEEGHPDKPKRWWIQPDRAHPAGNYVSIEVNAAASADRHEPVWIILAHLEQGSTAVKPGDTVRTGDVIARCGNSGNTSVPHLHIHAQAAPRVQPGGVWGLPVSFAATSADAGRNGTESWIRPGQKV